MKWLKKSIWKWLHSHGDEMIKNRVYDPSIIENVNADPVLSFRVFSAENGKVLEFNKYDRKTDRHSTTVYIIGREEDISEKVAKCINVELLR